MKAAGLVLAAGLTLAAAPAPMDVATFLAKADALKAKGIFALGSPDIALLKGAAQQAGMGYQAEKAERARTGKPPIACPPPNAKPMGGAEFMAGLQAIPVAQRRMSLKDAMIRIAQTRYPCR